MQTCIMLWLCYGGPRFDASIEIRNYAGDECTITVIRNRGMESLPRQRQVFILTLTIPIVKNGAR